MSIKKKYRVAAIIGGTLFSLACSDVPTSAPGKNADLTLATSRHAQTVASVTVTPLNPTIVVGQTVQLVATAKDSRGKVVTGATFVWSSSDASKVTVSSSGIVTGIATGSATVTATSGSAAGATNVTVSSQAPAPVASVVVSLSASTLQVGQTGLATATLRDASGNLLSGRSIAWQSSNLSVATISATGDLLAVAAGTSVITATSEGVSGSATLTVSATVIPVATVAVTLAPTSLTTGQTSQGTAVTLDANGNVLTGRSIGWASSVAADATVSSSGLVTAVSAGTTTISATSEGVTGGASLTVTAPVSSSTSPEPAAGDVILWQDNFDSRTNFSGYATAGVMSLVVGRGGVGKAARFSYSPGNDDNLIETGFTATSDIYFRFWYRITPPGALPYAGRTGSGIKWFMPWRAVGYRYTCGASLLDGGPAGFTNTGWEFGCHDNTSVQEPNPFVQNIDKTRKYSTTNDGNWHEYTLHIVVGNGGYEQIWIDGVRVSDSKAYAYDHSSEGISLVQLPGLVVDGIPDSSWNFAIDVDDFAIWHK